MAERQGLRLLKCRRRDPWALGFGTYLLVDDASNSVAAGDAETYGLALDDVERYLTTREISQEAAERIAGPRPHNVGLQLDPGGARGKLRATRFG